MLGTTASGCAMALIGDHSGGMRVLGGVSLWRCQAAWD